MNKAYIVTVSGNWGEYGSFIKWARNADEAKAKVMPKSSEYITLGVSRKKEWDKYAPDECVPIEELLKSGWEHYCAFCIDREDITQYDIDNGNAFIVNPQKKDGCIRGEIICKKCYKKLKNNKNYKIEKREYDENND